MTVVYCSTRNLYDELTVAVWSLLQHNPDAHVYLFIEDDEFAQLSSPQITVINATQYKSMLEGVNSGNAWTWMSLMRCALHKVLNEDKVIYLDVDTIVTGSLEKLWNIGISNSCMAGVTETAKSNGKPYYNAGVLLLNLSRLRSTGLGDKWLEEVRTKFHTFPDQDALNIVLEGERIPLSSKWNWCMFVEHCDHPQIIHYAGVRYWGNKPEFVEAAKTFPHKQNIRSCTMTINANDKVTLNGEVYTVKSVNELTAVIKPERGGARVCQLRDLKPYKVPVTKKPAKK